MGDWSSGMIPASGAGGREFDSRITPCGVMFYFFYFVLIINQKTLKYI